MREVYFTLVKEAPDYIRIRLEDSSRKVCVNIPKEHVRNFNRGSRYAFFDHGYLLWAFNKEMMIIEKKELQQQRAYAEQLKREKEKNDTIK
jgi:hypothetical protein